jgi:hypothetical protein
MLEKETQENKKLKLVQLDLEQKLAILNAQQSNCISFKETFPYVLRESLRYVQKKPSKLKHSLRTLSDEEV